MTFNAFMLEKNSGTPPVKLLVERSLVRENKWNGYIT